MKSINDVLKACNLSQGSRTKLAERIIKAYKIEDISDTDFMFKMSEADFIKVVAFELARDRKQHRIKFGQKTTGARNYNSSIGRYARIGW